MDIGAYEYPCTPSGIHCTWLQQFGLPLDGSMDHAGLDQDGMCTYQEYVADTVTTNPASVFRLDISADGRRSSWLSSSGRQYTLEWSTNLCAGLFEPIPEAVDLPGTPPHNAFTNGIPRASRVFFRAKVRMD